MRNLLLIILIIPLIISSCNRNEELKTKTITLTGYNRVVLNDNFNVVLEEDSLFSIELNGYDDIENVNYSIADSILTIENTTRFKWTKPRKNKIELVLRAPEFKEISANEACYISNEKPITSASFGVVFSGKANEANLKLAGGTFYYWNNFPCGGKLTLSGNTEVVKLWNYALVSVDAKELRANYGIVENSSQGDIDLIVQTRLEYGIHGKGNINLHNSPLSLINNGETNQGKLVYK